MHPIALISRYGESEDRRDCGVMSVLGVRRDKAALSSGCEPHPATAPAGSNRSSHGGNEVAVRVRSAFHSIATVALQCRERHFVPLPGIPTAIIGGTFDLLKFMAHRA